MSKKQLLTETEIRRFMKLARLEALSPAALNEGDGQIPQDAPDRRDGKEEDKERLKEEMPMDMAPPADAGMPELPADAGAPAEPEAVEMGGDVDPDKQAAFEAAVQALADAMGIEVELEGGGSEDLGDLEMDMGADGADEGPEEAGAEAGEEAGEEGGEEADEAGEGEDEEEDSVEETAALSEDDLVEAVLARVTARLVAEAKKKKLSVKDKMKAKASEKKEKVEEATASKGGGPLLSKGGNKHDTYKGHADKKWGKGENGGKGDDKMEDLPAKAENTVKKGGKNLATLGGNKKK